MIVALLLGSIVGTRAQSCDCPDICGVWLGQENANKVEIFRDGDIWQGKAVWDKEFGDVSSQDIMVLRNLEYNADKQLWSGKIYDPFHDKIFNVTVTLQPCGKLEVVGKAGVIKKKMVWTRVES